MKLRNLAGTAFVMLVLTLSATPPAANAQSSVPDRLSNMERRIQYLEKRVANQDSVIVEKDREIARLKKQDEKATGSWFNKIAITGGVELETSYASPYTGDDTSDAAVATATVGVAAQIHDWVGAEISLLYEEDDTPLEVDTASLTVGPPDGPWKFTGGQIYVPFGTFETNLISDPLTLEIGETRETALLVGFDKGGFFGSAYGFNGTNKDGGDNHIDGFGANAGYRLERENTELAVSLGYINDVGDSDNLQDVIGSNLGSNNVTDHVAAWTASAMVKHRGFMLIGEYLSALDDFQPGEVPFGTGGARPSAWNIEGGYGVRIAGKDVVFAVAWQGTDEALALELPESRLLAGLSVQVLEHAKLSFEWAHDRDYDTADGGTGKSADTATAQLAVEF